MSTYNKNIDLNYLEKIAFQDYAGARILWNLNIFYPSLHLLHESVEKYLKILWASSRDFDSKDDLNKKLKKFNHTTISIFEALPLDYQNILRKSLRKKWLKLYVLEGIRYGHDTQLVSYDEDSFRGAELFIKEIRSLLGRDTSKSTFEDLKTASFDFNPRKKQAKLDIFKEILSLPRQNPTKKQKAQHRRILVSYLKKSNLI